MDVMAEKTETGTGSRLLKNLIMMPTIFFSFIKYLSRARYCAKGLIYFVSFRAHNKQNENSSILILQMGNSVPETLSNLLNVTL